MKDKKTGGLIHLSSFTNRIVNELESKRVNHPRQGQLLLTIRGDGKHKGD